MTTPTEKDLAALEAAYIALLRLPHDGTVRHRIQAILGSLRDRIAAITGIDAEAVQTTYEAKAREPEVQVIWGGAPLPKYDGGPAFPGPYMTKTGALEVVAKQGGMTLRDYFAGQAATARIFAFCKAGDSHPTAELLADLAYEDADAMLKARGR